MEKETTRVSPPPGSSGSKSKSMDAHQSGCLQRGCLPANAKLSHSVLLGSPFGRSGPQVYRPSLAPALTS